MKPDNMKKKTKPKKKDKEVVDNYHKTKGQSEWRYKMTGGRML